MNIRVNNLSKSIATSSTLIVGHNPKRLWMALVNKGANRITISLTHPETGAAVGEICLYERGAVVLSRFSDMPWFGGVSGVAATAATDLAGVEVELR